jgi:hypothetical protein
VRAALVVALVAALGCRDATPPRAPELTTPAVEPPAGAARSLERRLAEERAARPAGAVGIEALASALAARGVEVVRARQVLAAPVGARYCAAAATRGGLGLALCEFDSQAAAEEGLRRSRARFDRSMPGRRLAAAGGSLLTIASDGPEAQLAAESFAALGATAHRKGE